jgi:hypothetical protein
MLHCAWRVCTRTRALEHPLLDPRSRAVKVALILDLETRTALSLHELLDLLCRTLKRFPRSAISTLSFCTVRPQERLQLSRKSLNRSDLTAGAHTETAVNNRPCDRSRAVAFAHLLGCAAGRQHETKYVYISERSLPEIYALARPAATLGTAPYSLPIIEECV